MRLWGVTACLKALEGSQEVPMDTLSIGLVMMLGLSSVSSSSVVQDDATDLTYLDTVTTSVGRVILSSADPNISSTGPIIEDITDWE